MNDDRGEFIGNIIKYYTSELSTGKATLLSGEESFETGEQQPSEDETADLIEPSNHASMPVSEDCDIDDPMVESRMDNDACLMYINDSALMQETDMDELISLRQDSASDTKSSEDVQSDEEDSKKRPCPTNPPSPQSPQVALTFTNFMAKC